MNPIYIDRAGNPWPDRRRSCPPEGMHPEGTPSGYLVLYTPPAAQQPPPALPVPEAPKTSGGLDKLAYTAAEAAEVLGVSRPLVYNLMHTEGFPVLRIGTAQRISVEGLAEWVRRQAGGGGP